MKKPRSKNSRSKKPEVSLTQMLCDLPVAAGDVEVPLSSVKTLHSIACRKGIVIATRTHPENPKLARVWRLI